MQQNELIQQAELHISNILNTELSPDNYYHNIIHTRRVVQMAVELAQHEQRSEQETALLQLAAWFHDIGYVNTEENHEAESAKIAVEYLTEKGLPPTETETVKQLILATKKEAEPKTDLEKIMKDADCAHLASNDFFDISENLRTEINLKTDKNISETDWLLLNSEFLGTHKFHTQYALKNWQPKKEINQFKIQQKINKSAKKEKKEKFSNRYGRGVETLFRVQLKNHIELSAIADTKANILLSVNAIIISVALANLIPKLDSPTNMYLVTPTFVLTIFSVISVVLSVLSTRPKISNIKVTQDMIKNKQTNILFFGNFHKMNLNEFEWGINYLLENDDVLYDSLTKDLYYLGLVLERKYRLLRITYTVFMIGIITSALAFFVSYQILVAHAN
ncbi:MAG: Pycsar system effector family protein [Flavobacteriaceae bacterium]